MPYYQDNHILIFNKDCSDMGELLDESIDLIVTDPPYQLSTIDRFKKPDSGEKWNVKSGVYHRIDKGFMGQEWDVLPPVEVWRESLRVLKPGAFAFIMTTPRQDSLCQILSDLTSAGFQMGFSSIFWAYASGFPKAQNIGKAVDKRLGVEREIVGKEKVDVGMQSGSMHSGRPIQVIERDKTIATTPQAKALDGSYGGFQPKPAVEVILVAMKPLSEKTFVDQALKNQKGITWLDDGRIPYEGESDFNKMARPNRENIEYQGSHPFGKEIYGINNPQGRFPANLLVSDDVLNEGTVNRSRGHFNRKIKPSSALFKGSGGWKDMEQEDVVLNDSGSFSRYFDLDKWFEERIKELPQSPQRTFPFLVVPKASKGEKNRGLGNAVSRTKHGSTPRRNEAENKSPNYHPTVKPVKLMSYLITLGSREGDTVLDNFGGSGTTAVAARLLGRKCVMYEIKERYCEIAVHRLRQMVLGLTF